MNKKQLAALVTFAHFALAALAADVSGTWSGVFHTREGGAFETTLTLKAEKDKLSGTLAQGNSDDIPIENPKLNGDTLTFQLTRQAQGQPIKVNYTGKIDGNKMKLTIQREGATRTQEIDLTKK